MKPLLSVIFALLLQCLFPTATQVVAQTPDSLRVLWIGTSIPAHCTYPRHACQALGYSVRNRSIGSSFLSIRPHTDQVQEYTGYSLTMTMSEKEELYRPWVNDSLIDEAMLTAWKYTSYDNLILSALDSTDVIIIDHGYNDCHSTLEAEYLRGREAVDWESEDRSTFIGAFNYLYRRIRAARPSVQLVIGGYFQDQCTLVPQGRYVAEVLRWIAEHYDLPLLDTWRYTDIPDGFVPNSSDYLTRLNQTYGTSFEPLWTDSLGNISCFQQFCPDGVHPWSDPTGHSDRVLDSIFTVLLPLRLAPCVHDAHVMFNEVMTNNIESLLYNHRLPDSWFELYNPTDRQLDLRHWSVGTSPDRASAYTFTFNKFVPSGGHALICCDGRDDQWEHTDFVLDPTAAGTLYLWDAEGTLVDSISYPAALGPDISYGRIMDGSPHWEYKLRATPVTPNVSGGSTCILPAPVLTAGPMGITLSAPAFDAPAHTYIYYTLDGSTPTLASSRLAADSTLLIPADSTCVVRARLMSPAAHASPTVTRTVVRHPRPTSLPVLSLSADTTFLYSADEGILVGNDWQGNCFRHWQRPVYVEYFASADSLTPQVSQQVNAGTHGLGELLYSQKSLQLDAVARYGCDTFSTSGFWPSKPQLRQARSFLLRNGGQRALDTRFEDAFAQELFGQHVPALQYQAYRPVIVYINGEYRGIYELRETDDRAWVESNVGITADEVTLVESLTSDDAALEPLRALLANDSATIDDYARLIDIPLLIDYLCAETFATNDDFPHNNVTLWSSASDSVPRLHALLRNLDYLSTTSSRTNWLNYLLCYGDDAGSVRNPEAHQLFIRLLALPAFRDTFIDRLTVYLGDFCKASVTLPMVDRMRDEIADEVASTFALMDEHPDYGRDFLGTIEQRLKPYCSVRPLLLCGNLNTTFRLGGVYLMTVAGADSINGIRLTEGDFAGCCFASRPVSLTTDDAHGWQLTVMRTDSTLEHYSFATPRLTFLPSDFGSDLDSLGLSIQPLAQMAGSHLMLNEIMQGNIDCVFADDAFPGAWVELHNPTDRPVSLVGYRLGENDRIAEAHRFTSAEADALTIAPGGYRLIYCDKDTASGPLHVPFRLDSGRGKLYLWDDSRRLIDSLTYARMPAPNVAYGRLTDHSTDWEYKCQPTPARANPYTGRTMLAPDPVFSEPGQVLNRSLTLHITLPDTLRDHASARIYYTTNGDEPTLQSPSARQVELRITGSTVVRAKVLGPGLIPARSVTHSYLELPRDNDFAVLSIVTDSAWLYSDSIGMLAGEVGDPDANFMQDWRRPVNIEWLQRDDLDINQIAEIAVGGATSRQFYQKSLKVYTHKRFGQKRFEGQLWSDKPDVLETKSFMLRNGGSRCRGSRINDAFGQRLFGRHVANLDWQSYEPVVVFINGVYTGHYELRERSNEDFVESNYGYPEEAIYRSDNIYYGEGNYADMIRAFWTASTDYDDLCEYVDMEELINYLCVECYTGNNDWPRNNMTSWRPAQQGGRWRWIVKDLDQFRFYPDTCNFLNYLFVSGPEGEQLVNQGFDNGHQVFRKLNRQPEFRQSFIDHLSVYLGDFLRPAYADSILVDMRVEMQPELVYTFRLFDPSDDTFYWAKTELTRLEEYVLARQSHLYRDISTHYDLGPLIPMTIDATPLNSKLSTLNSSLNTQNSEPSPLNSKLSTLNSVTPNPSPVTLNSLPLTTSLFDGFWYERHPFTLQAPSWSYGWTMTLTFRDGTVQSYDLLARPTIDLRDYPDLLRISFRLRPLDEAALDEIHPDPITPNPHTPRPNTLLDLFGRKVSESTRGIRIELTPDGSRKVIQLP